MASGAVRKRTRTRRNGEATSYWFVDYYDQHGKRHSKTFPTSAAAEDWVADVRIEVRTGIHTPDAGSITVKAAAEMWLRNCELIDESSRGTVRVYGQYVRLYIDELIGAKKLSRLTTPDVVAFTQALLPRTSRQRARKVLLTLKLILAFMQTSGYVAQNVAAPARIKLSRRDKTKLRVGVDVPSKAEVAAMLHHATGRVRARLVLAALGGLRSSEIRALFREDVDITDRICHVCRAADWWGTIGPVKSENGFRDIPMSPMLVNTLREWLGACPPSAPGAANRLDLVFPGRDGKVTAHSTLQTDFDKVQRQAGIVIADAEGVLRPKYSLHALRHFYASWGIEQGFPPKRLQELLGHGSFQMTYDRYGHWLGDIEDDHARLVKGEASLFGLPPERLSEVKPSRGQIGGKSAKP